MEDLSELDDFSTIIKLHYGKEMLILAKWKLTNTKFDLVKVTENSNIFSSSQVFRKRVVLRNFVKFTGKHVANITFFQYVFNNTFSPRRMFARHLR